MDMRHEFILPEHLLKAFMEQEVFRTAIGQCLGDPEGLAARIDEYLKEEVERVPEGISYEIEPSGQLNEAGGYAYQLVQYSQADELGVPHMVQGILQLKDSWAAHFLQQELGDELPEFIAQLVTEYELAEGNAPEETEGQPYEPGETLSPA